MRRKRALRGGPFSDFPNETAVDDNTIRDVVEMYREAPVFGLARKAFLSKVVGEPFSFSIPAIGIVSNKDMEKLITAYWMPWLRIIYDWIQIIGICPYYFEKLENTEHYIPVIPEMSLGYITVTVGKDHKFQYKWYWSHGTETEEAKNMLWIITENKPTESGIIRSSLASLLPTYSSLLKLKRAQDVAVTQCARPVHIMEHLNNPHDGKNDDLTHLVADFGAKAAGISKARREAAIQNNIRVKTAELARQLQATHNANTIKSTVQPTLWTETPADTLEEMDAGFSNRVVTLQKDWKYAQAAKPNVIVDYYKAEMQFNTLAAASMGFSMENLTPVGNARSQNIEGANNFENDCVRQQSAFYQSILKSALVIAYRKQFQQVMDDARNYRISTLGGDPNKVAFLYPELDVQVDMSSAADTNYEELKQMHMDGLITKETMAMHLFKNKNMPMDQMTTLEWPDKVPKEMLIRPAAGGDGGGAGKPKKKKAKKTA